MSKELSFPKEKIKIALLEKIDPASEEVFKEAGFKVDLVPSALDSEDLKKLIADVHIIGVRSRTHIKKEHLSLAKRLLAIGCFTVGTDQVDLSAARTAGVPVFNAPHSSTRSVAELTVCCMIMLARRLGDRNASMHKGVWQKSAEGSREIRGKTIGVIGYGHIGQQVGLLAEQLGLDVIFYDVLKKLPLGRARPVDSVEELLKRADFVTLHIPGGKENENLFSESTFKTMKKGSYFINHSRGKVVDIPALRAAIESGHIAGAAVDVFPKEPASGAEPFEGELVGVPNVVLSPHVGGSTEEAQRNIGREVANSLVNYIDNGSTEGAVNFPNISLPTSAKSHRIMYIHRNEPGALSEVNQVISDLGANVDAQYLNTFEDIGYLIMDISSEISEEVKEKISVLSKAVKTRILF